MEESSLKLAEVVVEVIVFFEGKLNTVAEYFYERGAWPRQPVFLKHAKRQGFQLKIKTGYWKGLF